MPYATVQWPDGSMLLVPDAYWPVGALVKDPLTGREGIVAYVSPD